MKFKKIFMLMIFSVFSLFAFSNGYAEELLNEEQIIEPTYEKVYVSPDDILICHEGIFFLNTVGDLTPARLISSDAAGLYVMWGDYYCPQCGYLNSTNRCTNTRCPLYGM